VVALEAMKNRGHGLNTPKALKCVELWCGDSTGLQGARDWARENNVKIDICTVDIDPKFKPTICGDILGIDPQDIRDALGLTGFQRPDFIWASPDCSVFSVAGFTHGHFKMERGAYIPQTVKAMDMIRRHKHTLDLIEALRPLYFVIENPVGLLRKMPWMRGFHQETVTYCQYGDFRMKPTDLWGGFPLTWSPRSRCQNNDPCHEAAPRGQNETGTQRLNRRDKSHIPLELSREIWDACVESKGYRRQDLREWMV
jgi:hypothetical protein